MNSERKLPTDLLAVYGLDWIQNPACDIQEIRNLTLSTTAAKHLTDIPGNPIDTYVRLAACKIFLTLQVYINVYIASIICPSYYISFIL